MKPLSLKSKIDLAFFAVAVVFCIIIYATYNRAASVTQNREALIRTYNSNTVLEKILSSTIDIENGGRGYTITGKEKFLSIYENGNRQVKEWIDSLEDMQGSHPEDQRRIDELKGLIDHKKAFTKLTIWTRREKGIQPAIDLISTEQGKEIMDSIRNKIANYQALQVQILKTKLAETDNNVKARNFNFLLFVFATLLIVVFAYSKIRMNAKQIVRDGEIQTKLSDELAYQNQQLNDFANIISHNLRSSSSNMQSLITLVDDDSSIDEYHNVFGMMKKVAQNLHESLNDLIEVLHIKKNKAQETESVSFAQVFEKVSSTLQGDILKHKARLTSDFSKAANVVFSKLYLESIFQNLIGNAMKYKSPGRLPEIKAWTEIDNGQTVLHIQDNGLGIDLKKHGHKIFGMYQMFHKHPEAKGIGLFITKTQIENCGGTISVSSDGHSGTTFTIRFAK